MHFVLNQVSFRRNEPNSKIIRLTLQKQILFMSIAQYVRNLLDSKQGI